ncbi:gag-pol polyprotein, partial [Trifolium medium]|nr:gag-pol polyprotein [Trifolium medium]
MIQELRDKAHFREFATKQRAAHRYNTRVMPRKFKEGDLVLKRPMGRDKAGKMAENWEGPFRIHKVFEGGAY